MHCLSLPNALRLKLNPAGSPCGVFCFLEIGDAGLDRGVVPRKHVAHLRIHRDPIHHVLNHSHAFGERSLDRFLVNVRIWIPTCDCIVEVPYIIPGLAFGINVASAIC